MLRRVLSTVTSYTIGAPSEPSVRPFAQYIPKNIGLVAPMLITIIKMANKLLVWVRSKHSTKWSSC